MLNPLDHPICLGVPSRICPSAWLSHTPFAMYLVAALRPRTLVELGTHNGCSYGAFCQSVKELDLGTNCFAVDTWEGDEHSGAYGPEILAELRAHHDPLYAGFSELLRMRFDDAVPYFGDGTVDLIHIDGFHSYEAVKHDFETWLPKLSPDAVVLFHDTNVRERDFGVWRFWDEVRASRPHFSFLHGYGLGVLSLADTPPERLRGLFEATDEEAARIRKFFYSAGDAVRQRFLIGEAQSDNRALHGRMMDLAHEADRIRVELENYRALCDGLRDERGMAQGERDARAAEIEGLKGRIDAAARDAIAQQERFGEQARAHGEVARMYLDAHRLLAEREAHRGQAERRHVEEVANLRAALEEIAGSRAWALARRLSGLKAAIATAGPRGGSIPRSKALSRTKPAQR